MTFKKSNEILETWSPHCKNLASKDPPSLNFHNRTDANIYTHVIYQSHEAAGELLTRSFRIAPSEVASLRVNRGSDRKLRKRQNSISKQM